MFIIVMSIGLLALSITSNNYLINSTWAQIEIFSNAESNSIPITSEVSLDNAICDFNSENPFSSNALLEKLRDDFCDEDSDAIENDDEIRNQIRDAEEEEDQPLPEEEQKQVEEEDQLAVKEHKAENDKDCRGGNVLDGASNEEDLKVLSECQEAA